MKLFISGVLFMSASTVFGSTSDECLKGNFSACREVFNKYGSQSDRTGAVDLFEKACSSQSLKVTCQITSSSKQDTLKKALETAQPNAGSFTINGTKIDKIYQISELK